MISAKILTDSINSMGNRMTTFEIEYPRFILAEVNTHRMLSKNSSSSRAIPNAKVVEQVTQNPAIPVYWGKNKAGMQATEEIDNTEEATKIWLEAMKAAVGYSTRLANIGVHKEVCNRLLEPWMTMKTVISGTEWANFFYLRKHIDAQPEFRVLAEHMQEARDASKPRELHPGEWHLPYINYNGDVYADSNGTVLDVEEAKIVSAACCAQVSYRKSDDTLDKCRGIFNKLGLGSVGSHASPVEHQATPIGYTKTGVTHMTKDLRLWSGNLCGWEQHRKLIPNESVMG